MHYKQHMHHLLGQGRKGTGSQKRAMQSWRTQSALHKGAVILDVSFQTGQACSPPKPSVAVANAQHLSKTTHPHVMSWLLKWKASPARCQSVEMTGKIVPGVCSRCGQPRKPPADAEQAQGAVPGTCISSLWYLNQICAC